MSYLEKERSLLSIRIELFSDAVTRTTNLNRFAEGGFALVGLGVSGGVFGLTGSTLGEVGLVAFALGVGEVVALVVVEGEAELALVAPQVVAHEVRVLR